MSKEETLPNSDFAFDLLKKLKVPYNVRRHSLKVADKALEIAEKIKLKDVDLELIEIGGLLHDIGRCKTHGFNHALIGANIIIYKDSISSSIPFLCSTNNCKDLRSSITDSNFSISE